ncbi:hypothetical protein [Sphingomonas sp. LT1P40]|uniref:hypothetical protein n=1 Tax=Alteristakelama amylovorans TaxID=3096166 RepID=UPI002FCAD4D1
MAKPIPTRFSVTPENVEAAVSYCTERGFPPVRIEADGEGFSYLIFAPLPHEQMPGLVSALPIHLSAKVGIVAHSDEEFERLTRNQP